MATTPVNPSLSGEANNVELSTERVTTRGYVQLDAAGLVEKIYARAEIKDHSNWAKLEKEGFVKFNENQFVRYTLKSEEAFALLVPDAQRRLEIVQDGINYVQNSRMNALAIEIKEGTGVNNIPAEPSYNDELIDLKEFINVAKVSKRLSPDEQLERALKNTGLPDHLIQQMLQAAMARIAARTAPAEQQASSEASSEAGSEAEEVSA